MDEAYTRAAIYQVSGASPQVTYQNFEEEDSSRSHTNQTMTIYS